MRPEIFVDSSAWFPLSHPANSDHQAVAKELRARMAQGARPVTTNLVIAETHSLILHRVHRSAAREFLHEVRRPPNVVVASDEELEARAQREWLERYGDQDFSLTDAVSFALMAERGIRDALALDRRFATAGFTLVP
jgi:predicted nucleic acid-binding protein